MDATLYHARMEEQVEDEKSTEGESQSTTKPYDFKIAYPENFNPASIEFTIPSQRKWVDDLVNQRIKSSHVKVSLTDINLQTVIRYWTSLLNKTIVSMN